MLDERKAAILRAVVEEYIDTAQPVGSGHVVAGARGAACRRPPSATTWPPSSRRATSASPTPAPAGSPPRRATASSSTTCGQPGRAPGARTRSRSARSSTGPTASSSRCCTTPAGCSATSPATPASSSGPPATEATVRSVQLVGLAPPSALLVVVLSQRRRREAHARPRRRRTGPGRRRRRASGSPPPAPTSARTLAGAARSDAAADRRHRRRRHRRARARSRSASLRADRGTEPDQVFVGGTSRMARGLRRRRDRPRGARHPRAAVRRRHPAARRARPRACRSPSAPRRAWRRSPSARSIVAPYQVEGEPAGTIGVLGPTRMNYPQALAAVAVVSQRLAQPPHARADVAGRTYYELLGRRRATRPPTRSSAPTAGWPASSTPTRTPTPRPRPGSRRWRWPTRCCRDPEQARGATTASAPTACGAAAATRSASAAAGINDIFEAFFGGDSPFGGGGRGPARPAARARPRAGRRPRLRGGRVRRASTRSTCAHRGRLRRRAAAPAPRPGTEPITCRECGGAGQVRRVRQSFLGQMVTHRRRARGARASARSSPTPCPDCRGEGRRTSRTAPTPSTSPPASTPAPRCGSPGRGGGRPAGRPAGDLYVHVRVQPARPVRARRRRPALRPARARFAQAALGAHLELRHARRHRGPRASRAARRPAASSACGAGACPTSSGASGATSIVRVVVDVPTDLTPEQEELLRQLRRAAGRGRGAGRRRLPLPDPLRVPLSASAAMAHPADHPGPLVFVDDLDAPELADADDHHLARVLRLRAGDAARPSPTARGAGGRRCSARRSRPTGAVEAAPAPAPAARRRLRAGEGRQARAGRAEAHRARASTGSCRSGPTRSVVRWDDGEGGQGASSGCASWRREAAMQSRRPWLPEVAEVADLADLLAAHGAGAGARRRATATARPRRRRPCWSGPRAAGSGGASCAGAPPRVGLGAARPAGRDGGDRRRASCWPRCRDGTGRRHRAGRPPATGG